MYNIIAQGEHETPYVTHFVADTAEDIAKLPTNVATGSDCFIISTSQVYMLNGNKEWIEI